ncbi:hypothetical protein ACJX0J_023759, partial [Zea mays]
MRTTVTASMIKSLCFWHFSPGEARSMETGRFDYWLALDMLVQNCLLAYMGLLVAAVVAAAKKNDEQGFLSNINTVEFCMFFHLVYVVCAILINAIVLPNFVIILRRDSETILSNDQAHTTKKCFCRPEWFHKLSAKVEHVTLPPTNRWDHFLRVQYLVPKL